MYFVPNIFFNKFDELIKFVGHVEATQRNEYRQAFN